MADRPSNFASVVTALNGCFRQAAIEHAFGGAFALAFYAEPRATADIDVGIHLQPFEAGRVREALAGLAALPSSWDESVVESDGWGRIEVAEIPCDLFFSSGDFQDEMFTRVREAPFGGERVPIVAAEDLIVMKALFDRPKDWLDIEAIRDYGPIPDLNVVRTWLLKAQRREALSKIEELWQLT